MTGKTKLSQVSSLSRPLIHVVKNDINKASSVTDISSSLPSLSVPMMCRVYLQHYDEYFISSLAYSDWLNTDKNGKEKSLNNVMRTKSSVE